MMLYVFSELSRINGSGISFEKSRRMDVLNFLQRDEFISGKRMPVHFKYLFFRMIGASDEWARFDMRDAYHVLAVCF
jgi:hypothetical protein